MPRLRAYADGAAEQNASGGDLRTLRLPNPSSAEASGVIFGGPRGRSCTPWAPPQRASHPANNWTPAGTVARRPQVTARKGVLRLMDASHILVGGLTAISIALLVWIEIRSRRNTTAQEQNPVPEGLQEVQPPRKRRSSERRIS